jgi:hypothetical protein
MGLAECLTAQMAEGERWMATEVPETPDRTEKLLLAIKQAKLSEDSSHLLAMIRQVDMHSPSHPPILNKQEDRMHRKVYITTIDFKLLQRGHGRVD